MVVYGCLDGGLTLGGGGFGVDIMWNDEETCSEAG